MNAFTTHPSVRIRGTENNYEPVQCMAPQCANKVPHMHCPFCTKAESFVDPVILKAHYRVKHVDKGIEFAGLKVLRCCDHCDIVGTIKGVKEFKGAHWHCYKCKNGFNRRDEAIKHYRTHFRNPQTTFQIQITQEINQMYPLGHEVETATETLAQQDLTTIHPALTEAVMTTTATELLATQQHQSQQQEAGMPNGRTHEGEVHVSVAANETVDASDGQTIMIIHEDSNQLDSGQEQVHQEGCTFQITNASGAVQLQSVDQVKVPQHHAQHHVQVQQEIQQVTSDMDQRLLDLQQRNEQLEVEKAQLEHEVEQLKLQVHIAGQDLSAYQKREQDLLAQLSIPLDERIHELLRQLKADHEDLLHQQLAHLRKSYLGHHLTGGTQPEGEQLTQGGNIIIVAPDAVGAGTDPAMRLTDPGEEGGPEEGEYVAGMVGTSEDGVVDITTSCHNTRHTVERTTEGVGTTQSDPHGGINTGAVTSSNPELVGNNVTVTLSSEQFEELEGADVEHQTHIVITDEMVGEPPEKRNRIT